MGTNLYAGEPSAEGLENLSEEERANEHSGSKSAEHNDEGPNTEVKSE